MLNDGQNTLTSNEQAHLEKKVYELYEEFSILGALQQYESLRLTREKHIEYLRDHLGDLPGGFLTLDASRTWIVFWILHSLALFKAPLPEKPSREAIIAFLKSCQHPGGGFGGGPHQLPHLAATFSTVSALVTLGGSDALKVVDREGMMRFLESMCVDPDRGGGFTIHEGGEVDTRGCYTAIATAHMLGLDKVKLAEKSGMVEFIRRCQSHEGGVGGEPGNEAHGGNTFCGVAALVLIGRVDVLDLDKLLHWLVHMQGGMEGGFMGRTNKLVDGCYSYWQGAMFPLLEKIMQENPEPHHLHRRPVAAIPDIPDLPNIGLDEPVVQRRKHEQRNAALLANSLGMNLEDLELMMREDELVQDGQTGSAPGGFQKQMLREALQSSRASILATKFNASTVVQSAVGMHGSEVMLISDVPDANTSANVLYDVIALQFWILRCCQGKLGGLRDKPGKPVDLYHTCYCLSGLSSAQQYSGAALGPVENILARCDLAINVVDSKLEDALAYYAANPL